MKKTIVLVLALILCLSLCACGSGGSNVSDKKPETVELTVYNFEEYLTVTFEIKNFDEGQLAPGVELYNPTFDLVVNVKAVDPEYKFTNTVLKLILTDKANATNLTMSSSPAELVIDENGNGTFTKEGISWTASTVAKPQYQILTAVSEVSGIASNE